MLTEELHEETRRMKEQSLRQFQDAVRRRVSEQARIRKQQRLQALYKTVGEDRHTQKVFCSVAGNNGTRYSLFRSISRQIDKCVLGML